MQVPTACKNHYSNDMVLSSYLPNKRAIRAVVPEELSRALASLKARSAFTNALLIAFLMPDGK